MLVVILNQFVQVGTLVVEAALHLPDGAQAGVMFVDRSLHCVRSSCDDWLSATRASILCHLAELLVQTGTRVREVAEVRVDRLVLLLVVGGKRFF